jgi:hypothetical protein
MGMHGRKHSEESKARMREAKLGKKHSEEHKAIMSESLKGRVHSEEARRKMSETQKGRKKPPRSEETKAKISETLSGRKRSEETRRKISESLTGKCMPEETKAKISESKKGRKHSEEHKAKLRGKTHTEETKARLRELAFEYAAEMGGFTYPNIGRNETQILDNLEQELDHRIIRQFKVGGYFLDGYIPEINLAIEVDEKYHQYQTEKDKIREEFIKAKLGCQFLRIKDY